MEGGGLQHGSLGATAITMEGEEALHLGGGGGTYSMVVTMEGGGYSHHNGGGGPIAIYMLSHFWICDPRRFRLRHGGVQLGQSQVV